MTNNKEHKSKYYVNGVPIYSSNKTFVVKPVITEDKWYNILWKKLKNLLK